MSSIERYSVGLARSGSVAAGAAYAELLASAGSPVSVKSISVTTATAIGGSVALVRSFAVGTGTTVYTGICHRSIATQATGPARVNTAWSQAPTGYVPRLREEVMPTATGQTRLLWDDATDGPLVVEPSESILLINGASGIDGGGLRINLSWEEGRR